MLSLGYFAEVVSLNLGRVKYFSNYCTNIVEAHKGF